MDCSQLPAHGLSPFTSTVYEQTWNELNHWNAEHVPSEIAPHQLNFVHGESSVPYQQPPSTPRQHEEPVDGYQPVFHQGDVSESLRYEAVTFEHYRVYCPEIQKPHPKEKSGSLNLKFQCPRCSTRFSRRYSVKSHFPSCIERHGNPDALKWNEHASAKGYQPRKRNRYNIFRSLTARGKKNGSRRKHGW